MVVLLVLVPAAAGANDHRWDFSAGFSFARGSALWGIHQTAAVTSPRPGSRDLSIVGDFSLHLGSSGGNDVTRATFLGGARWAWALPAAGPDEKHLLLAHVLAGAVRDHVGAQSRTDPAVAFGGAYEYDPNGHASALAFRMQVDYVHAFRGGEGFPRATFAFVHRIN